MITHAVTIYDPDPINPYGSELARILRSVCPSVTLFAPTKSGWTPSEVDVRNVLAGDRSDAGLLRTIWLRLTGIVRTVGHALRTRSPLVVVWQRDTWDGLIMLAGALAGVRVITIIHNPQSIRPRTNLAGTVGRWLNRRADTCVVHTAKLAVAAAAESKRIWVAPHPAYTGWVGTNRRASQSPRPKLLLLGAMRPDKGIGYVPAVLRALESSVDILVAGKGSLPPGWADEVASTGATVERTGTGGFLSDQEIATALGKATLLLAPYDNATQSGSLILALSWGLPSIGFASGGIESLLTDESLVPIGDTRTLANRIDAFVRSPWPTFRCTPADLDARCAAAWRDLLAASR